MKTFKKKICDIMSKNIHTETFYNFLHEIKHIMKYGHIYQKLYLILENKKLIYFVNMKVACSSIEACLCGEETTDNYGVHSIVDEKKLIREGFLSKKEKKYYKFTFVRNPFERLVSCYESKYHTDRKRYQWKRLRFDCYLGGYIRKDKGFENFVRKVVKIPPYLMDTHFMMQYDLVYDRKGNICVDYCGKYENLNNEFEKIQKRFNLKELPFYNVTSDKKNWMEYYNLETADLVYKKYERDIRCFGYQETYNELVNYLKGKESVF